ncbi:MAG: exonuclease domain-containing protein [Planctomycetia bacterium]
MDARSTGRRFAFAEMEYVVVDLEATCWSGRFDRLRMEVIEIGAVRLPKAGGPPDGEFARFVRPLVEPTLSDYCRTLTSIRQEDVDAAPLFAAVMPELAAWAEAGAFGATAGRPFVFCSWGAFDKRQLELDCRRHGLTPPDWLGRHLNLKDLFAKHHGVQPCGMAEALQTVGMPLVGTHHRAVDDARNIARLAALLLPRWEVERTPTDSRGDF